MCLRPLLASLLIVFAFGCEKKLMGPSPEVQRLTPNAVCQDQKVTRIALDGRGLAPLSTQNLEAQQLELPRITLIAASTLGGEAATGSEISLPDDPTAPDASRVRWTSQEQMSFDIFPELGLAPGLYDVQVANPSGNEATLAGSLLAVPPPVVNRAVADLLCSSKGNAFRVEGSGFIRAEALLPTVHVGELTLQPDSAEGCVALPGSAGLEQCTTLLLTLTEGALPPGNHAVIVNNPAPVDCQSSEPVLLTLVPEPTLVAVVPDLVCTEQGDDVLLITGSDFLTVDGVTPRLVIANGSTTLELATTVDAADCEAVEGPSEAVQRCTRMTAVLSEGALGAGTWNAHVQNPAPADCRSPTALPFTIVSAPQIAALLPQMSCADEGAVEVIVEGSDLLVVDGTAPTVTFGTETWPTTFDAADCTALMGPTTPTLACTRLRFSVPQGTAAGTYPVSVTNPAPAGCRSAEGPVFTLFGAPTVASAQPAAVCYDAEAAVAIVLEGTGFLTVDGEAPAVAVGGVSIASVAPSNCTAVPSVTSNAVESCTTLTVSVPPGSFSSTSTGPQLVTVRNPEPASCGSTGSTQIEISAPPSISSIEPATVCSSGGRLTLNGTGFAAGATVSVGTQSTSADVRSATLAYATFQSFATGLYDVSIANVDGCGFTAPSALQVVPGPQLFFVDPSVIYDGILTKATVYGSGFTGAVSAVEIEHIDPMTGVASGIRVAVPFSEIVGRNNQVQIDLAPQAHAPGAYNVYLKDTTACEAFLASAFTITDRDNDLVLAGITPGFGYRGEQTGVSIAADTSTKAGFIEIPRVYLNPRTPGGTPAAVGAVSFVNDTLLTGVVPSGLSADEYDLIVVNPDGRVGVQQSAFRVVNQPLPTISSLSPGAVANSNPATFAVLGENFRASTVSLACFDTDGVPLATSPSATVDAATATATRLDVTFNASVGGAGCIVRVTNPDEATFTEYSALVITNPAFNLRPGKAGQPLNVARRAPLLLPGNATTAARFLHAISGDDGNGGALRSVESAPVNLYGEPGLWRTQRNGLQQARTLAAGAQIGRFLYVVGGSHQPAGSMMPTVLSSIERAVVLDPADRGEITDLALEIAEASTLSAGLYYYRVAAVMSATDAFNPGGENLASDPFPVKIPDAGAPIQVSVFWKAVPGAASYVIYRSPTAVDAAGSTVRAGDEQQMGVVSASAPRVFVDDGSAIPSLPTPLPIGSTGVWQTLPVALQVPREGAAVAWSPDPANATRAFLYVLGGRSNPTTALRSYESLRIDLGADGSQALATATSLVENALGAARWQLGATRAGNDLNSSVPAGSEYIYALGGLSAAGSVQTRAEAALVSSDGTGTLGAFVQVFSGGINRAGFPATAVGNQIFGFGGFGGSPDTSITSGEISTAPSVINFNATGDAVLATPRYLAGGTLSGAFLYVVGGVSSASPLTVTPNTEFFLW